MEKNFCTARFEANDPLNNFETIIPVEGTKGISSKRKRLRFAYRWRRNDTIFEIFINNQWREAQSIDFNFD